ncbi:MAG: DUF928 domain-containing protein [Oculatellaceae cyanobacterium bins.114]|nr:DUF928 domain-containing protein [Oculatellaceae cyanobacterium bins.114]
MIWQTRLIQRCLGWIVVFSISSMLVLTLTPPAQAGLFDLLFGRRNREAPRRGTGEGASIRDDGCSAPVSNQPLFAFVPPDGVGSTTQDYPTFLFYVPFARSPQMAYAEFMLLDDQQNYAIDRPIRVTLPETIGLVQFRLPETAPPLATNQRYNWYFSIICDAEEPSRNPVISGWIQRTAPSDNLALKLRVLPGPSHYRAYEAENAWYDALASLADYSSDRSLQPLWSRILGAYELEGISQQAIPELTPVSSR